jgi:hypothetical protein
VKTTFGQRVRTVAPPVAAVALLAVAFVLPDGSDDPRPPGPVTVERSAYACPGGKGVTVAAGQVAAGTSATVTTLPDRRPLAPLADATRWRRTPLDTSGVVVDQRGKGSGAVGFYAGVARKSAGGGLIVGTCPPTTDDSWYLGLGSGARHLSSVALTNMSSSPAVADISFWGRQGKVDAINSKGILVGPFSVRRVDLRDLAAGEPELAVHVERRRGALAVSALDTSTTIFHGTEAPEPTAAPTRKQIVAGIPSGSTGRTLLLLNPTTSTARVAVRVIGSKGSFAPQGLESVKVAAGRLKRIDVPKSAGADRAALSLTSDQPVSASVRVASTTKDHAVLEALPALDGPAVVPVDLGTGSPAPELVLTAPGRRATVHLEGYDEQMRRKSGTDVTIEAGTTKGFDLAARKVLDTKGVAYVVVRAQGGVVGAATYRRGSAIASLGLLEAPVTVLGPQVRPIS